MKFHFAWLIFDPCRRFGHQLGQGMAFPVAEGQFDETVVGAVGEGIEPHGAAQDFHGLARAPERACDEVEIGDGFSENALEGGAVAGRLLAAGLVQRNILLPLQPALCIPRGLAVSDHVDEQGRASGSGINP